MKHRYRIAGKFFAEFRYDPTARMPLFCDWDPERPDELRGAARRRYDHARADFALRVQKEMGRPLVIIESFDMPDALVEDLQLAIATPGGRA